jgi:hypothetical protein
MISHFVFEIGQFSEFGGASSEGAHGLGLGRSGCGRSLRGGGGVGGPALNRTAAEFRFSRAQEFETAIALGFLGGGREFAAEGMVR